jgi:hypothetical protein
VLVGHSYGGSVITVAGDSDKVAGFVCVAGLVPDEGESVTDLQSRFPSLAMGPILQPRPLHDGGVELSVDPERFHDVFGADLPEADAAFMAYAQRPLLATAFEDPAAAAAWRMKPSWAVFGTADLPVAPELHRFQYTRAGSTVTEIEGASHFVMLSHPDVVAGVIRDAVTASASPAEARASVLERFAGRSAYANHGERVVRGQRLMQAETDFFLGWHRIKGLDGVTHDYYVRQFHDWKGGAEVENLRVSSATLYACVCAATLARAHARWGDRI